MTGYCVNCKHCKEGKISVISTLETYPTNQNSSIFRNIANNLKPKKENVLICDNPKNIDFNYVDGSPLIKSCATLNFYGECKYFEPLNDNEPILPDEEITDDTEKDVTDDTEEETWVVE